MGEETRKSVGSVQTAQGITGLKLAKKPLTEDTEMTERVERSG